MTSSLSGVDRLQGQIEKKKKETKRAANQIISK